MTDVYIGGSLLDRPAARVQLEQLTLSLDGPDSIEFTERVAALPGTFGAADSITVVDDGATIFAGRVVGSYTRGVGRGEITVGYRAMGLNWAANRIAITAVDGSGRQVFNMPSTEPDYSPNFSGLTVGRILEIVFVMHAAELAAAGISGWSAGDLAALDVVPPEPVVAQGRLWNFTLGLVARWHAKCACWVDPATTTIRIASQLSFPRRTVVLDDEPVVLESISRDHAECYTRVVCRGGPDVRGAYLRYTEGSITPGWSPAEEAAWTLADYLSPRGASDSGEVLAETSTTLDLQPDDATLTWAANDLSAIAAEVWAYNPLEGGSGFGEQRRITSNTALTAGGTYTVTVDTPFSNGGYTRYAIRGRYAAQSLVWRKYLITPAWVAEHLVRRLSHTIWWHPSTASTAGAQVTSGQAEIYGPAGGPNELTGVPATFDLVMPDGVNPGYIVFNKPVVGYFGTQSLLQLGGSSVDGIPSEIVVLVPYSVGALTAEYPADSGGSPQYAGTAKTVDGLEETLYREYPQWLDYRERSNFARLAEEVHDTVSNTVVEGRLTHWSKCADLLRMGTSIDVAGDGYATGYEDINAPIRTVVLDYCSDGGASIYRTSVRFSNRLKAFSGDRLYVHPSFAPANYGLGRSVMLGRPAAAPPDAMGEFLAGLDGGQSAGDVGFDPSAFVGGPRGKGFKELADDRQDRKFQARRDRQAHNIELAGRQFEAAMAAPQPTGMADRLPGFGGVNVPSLTEGQRIEQDQEENARRARARQDARNLEGMAGRNMQRMTGRVSPDADIDSHLADIAREDR